MNRMNGLPGGAERNQVAQTVFEFVDRFMKVESLEPVHRTTLFWRPEPVRNHKSVLISAIGLALVRLDDELAAWFAEQNERRGRGWEAEEGMWETVMARIDDSLRKIVRGDIEKEAEFAYEVQGELHRMIGDRTVNDVQHVVACHDVVEPKPEHQLIFEVQNDRSLEHTQGLPWSGRVPSAQYEIDHVAAAMASSLASLVANWWSKKPERKTEDLISAEGLKVAEKTIETHDGAPPTPLALMAACILQKFAAKFLNSISSGDSNFLRQVIQQSLDGQGQEDRIDYTRTKGEEAMNAMNVKKLTIVTQLGE